jgi:ribosomal-protein-alanine N-acetyltransferase
MRWFSIAARQRRDLKTERLVLRAPTPAHWVQWSAVRASSREFLTPWEPLWGPAHLTEEGYHDRFLKSDNDGSRTFFLLRQEDGQLMGGVTIANIRHGVALSASVGYWLARPYTGQGYMTEALRRLVGFCFDDLYLHRIEAACIPENTASRKVVTSVGFREEGLARQYLKINGQWRDHVLYGLLREDVK